MSAFVCCFDRSGEAVDRQLMSSLAAPLERSGLRVSTVCRGSVGLAFGHPQDLAVPTRNGPLTDPRTGLTVAWVGWYRVVDEELEGVNPDRLPRDSPNGILGPTAFLQRGAGMLGGLAGSFVFIAVDPRGPGVTVARDHLGDYRVSYYLDRRWLIAASDPTAILRHPAVPTEIDQRSVARFLGFRFSQCDQSFFCQIRELPPAHWLQVTASESDVEQYWRFRVDPEAWKRPPDQVRSDFLGEVRRSLAYHLMGTEPGEVALSLSGGLDSTVLAALAPLPVRAFSWYLEDTPEADERNKIEAVAEHLGIPHHWVDAEGLYPLCGEFVDRFVHRRSPYVNAFAGLKQRLFEVAKSRGCKQVMVGDAGDALYGARQYWLRDMLVTGRPLAFRSLLATIRKALQGDAFARQALLRLLPVDGLRPAVRRLRRPPWLTPAAHACLPDEALSPILPQGRWRHRYDCSVGTKNTELESEERLMFANEHGIGRSNPFWHWPLLETVLNLPAYWYHQDGLDKVLVRAAMQGLLPDGVLQSGRTGLLGAVFLRGVESNHQDLRERVFRHPRSDWQRYVERDWVEPYLSATGSISFGHTILWRVISYENWYRKLIQ